MGSDWQLYGARVEGHAMRTARAIRLSGLAAMLGGMMWIATIAITATTPEQSRRGPGGLIALLLAGLVLIGLGVVGVYFHQRQSAGRLGTVAMGLTVLGLATTVLGRITVDVGLVPDLVFQIGLLLFVLGLILFVVTVFTANVMPRGAAALLVVGVLSLAIFNFGDERIWLGMLFGAAWIWLGYALWSGNTSQPVT